MAAGAWKSCFHSRRILLTLLAAGCVLGLTHIPGEDMPRVLQVHALDKVEHVVAYGVITAGFLFSLKRPTRWGLLLAGLLALAAIGALDEMTQPLVNRTCDLRDFICDLTGIVVPGVVFAAVELLRFRTVLPPERM